MRSFWCMLVLLIAVYSCNDGRYSKTKGKDNPQVLHTDRINIVRLSDKLLIDESICRGCEYENSVRFSIRDSLEIVKLEEVITIDDSPPDMDGGYVSKEVMITPLKPGITTIRLYKILSSKTAKEDSARFKTYTIEVKN